jgi:hypothetical protein
MVARVSGQGCEIPLLVNDLGIQVFFPIAMWHFFTHFACKSLIIDILRSISDICTLSSYLFSQMYLAIREVLTMEFWWFKEITRTTIHLLDIYSSTA